MEFTYQEIRRGLIKYFTRVEGYKSLRSKIHAGVVYFYSPKAEYSVIRVSDQVQELKNDEELNHLVNKMQTSSHHQPKVLSLIISDQTTDLVEIQAGYWQLMSDEPNLKLKLEPIFARINHLKIESSENTSFFKRASKINNNLDQPGQNNNADENEPDLENLDLASMQKELKVFAAKTRANRLVLTWVMLALFGLVPVSGMIVTLFLKLDFYEINAGLQGLERLFTGGTNYTLTIAGHQWWRIFSFGFAVPGSGVLANAMIIILAGIALYGLMKYSETVIGIWKTLLAFFVAYLLTSLFSTIMLPDSITGGILPLVGISLGILVSGIGTDMSLKSRFVRMKLVWPVIVLLFFPIFNGGLIDYVPIIAGIAFGASVMGFIPHQIKLSRTSLVIYGLILITMIVLIITFAFIPRFTPALDSRTVYTLLLYVQNGFLPNADYANSIMDKIGWAIKFEELGDMGLGITQIGLVL